MNNYLLPWQNIFLIFLEIFSFFVFLKSFYESKYRKNVFGLTRPLLPLGIFVWADGVVLGIFWQLVSVLSLIAKSWLLFLLLVSIYWTVRGVGETIYWLNQQFSILNRNPPCTLPWQNIFHNDSIWFIHQLIWQCITVFGLLGTIHLLHLWQSI
jgi:hypothetical protein